MYYCTTVLLYYCTTVLLLRAPAPEQLRPRPPQTTKDQRGAPAIIIAWPELFGWGGAGFIIRRPHYPGVDVCEVSKIGCQLVALLFCIVLHSVPLLPQMSISV